MDLRVRKLLEYDKILEKVSSFAHSKMAKEKILNLTPTSDYDEVSLLLSETDEALSLIITKSSLPICGFSDITSEIARLNASSPLNCAELLRVCSVLKAAKRVKNNIGGDNIHLLSDLADDLFYDEEIINSIERAIISDTEVSDFASNALKTIRRKITSEHEKIKEKLQSIIKNSQTSKYLMDDIITLRGNRYVVPVKSEHKSSVPGIVHDQSGSGQTLFIEPIGVVESNNKIRELESEEKAEIERILKELSGLLIPYCEALKINLKILCKLDIIFSKALYSREINGILPKQNSDGITLIKDGKHPLIDKNTVVPVTIAVGETYRGLIITGPNTGGKTVTLKLAGLLQLMFQSGIFIPAGIGTKMCVYKDIYADIGDEQSIEQSLSTFSSHMKNIISITKHADEKSLVLLDELGAGTDPSEGAALSIAILEEMRDIGAVVLATTHYSEIKAFALSDDYFSNAGMEFDIASLSPTYKLFIGIPGMSNAFLISSRLGLDEYIIERAKTHLSQEHSRFELVLGQAEAEHKQNLQIKQELLDEYEELKSEREKLNEKIKDAAAKNEQIISDAKEKAAQIVKDAKNETEEIIKELKRKKNETAISDKTLTEISHNVRTKIDNLSEKLVQKPKKEKPKKPVNIKKLMIGDDVFILSLGASGIVQTLPDSRGNLTVMAGVMKLNVHFSDLEPTEKKPQIIHRSSVKLQNKSVALSLDVHGMDLENALLEVDRYLDACVISNLNEVTIIHGKGKGILMKGIREYLRSNKQVKSFRSGMYGEGEAGVTVVTLK